jgi:hypothetical protein
MSRRSSCWEPYRKRATSTGNEMFSLSEVRADQISNAFDLSERVHNKRLFIMAYSFFISDETTSGERLDENDRQILHHTYRIDFYDFL